MKKALLIILKDEKQYNLLTQQLSDLKYTTDSICRCNSIEEAISGATDSANIILADILALKPDASVAIQKLQKHFVDAPVIVIVDKDDKAVTISAIRAGAQDVLVTGNYDQQHLENIMLMAVERQSLMIKNRSVVREYHRQFDNGPVPMWVVDTQTMKFLAVNNAAIVKYGYSKDEFLNMTLKDIRPSEDVASLLKGYHEKRSEFYDAGVRRHMKKNGEIFYAHVYSHNTLHNDAHARLSFAIDVNEQVLMERNNSSLAYQIKEQNEQLDNLLYSIGYAIWSRRADSLDIIYAYPNNAYYKLFGYTADEMVKNKRLFFNNVHPDDRQAVYNSLKEAATKGSSEIVFRFAHLDGSIRTFKSQITLKAGNGSLPDTVTGVTFDITKEKQLTETIRNTELNLLATINNTKDMIWSINTKLEIVFCNKSYQDSVFELAGVVPVPGDYVLGEWGSESFFNTRKKDYERALAGESFTTFIEEYYNGSFFHKEISTNPIYDDEVNIVGVICIARDISEQKNQFVQIQRQNEKLREIAWIQSHKVRGPVASILGLASLFNYDINDHHNNIEILEKLKIATDNLDSIIKEVVDKTKNIST